MSWSQNMAPWRSAPAVPMRRPRPARWRKTRNWRPAPLPKRHCMSQPIPASTPTTTLPSRCWTMSDTATETAAHGLPAPAQQLTPREIVSELDRYIIGQAEAKRSVAIALRNRWRRMQLDETIRGEITPKNILMIGPTGVGKTEIARRLAKLANAPFLKIEATKFTEVGYVGREVDSIIRDLVDIAIKMEREQAKAAVRTKAEDAAEDRILDVLLPRPQNTNQDGDWSAADDSNATRQVFRKRLREGKLDDKEIELDLQQPQAGVEIMAPPGMEEMTSQLQDMFQNMRGSDTKRKKTRIRDA